jgi:hypothetical protein
MDRISIQNLFSPEQIGRLDVDSLSAEVCAPVRSDKPTKINLNIQKMRDVRESKKAKLYAEYENQFGICVKRIELANDMGWSQVAWEPPSGIYGNYNYDPEECVEYVGRKLKSQGLDVENRGIGAMGVTQLVISWRRLLRNEI